MFGFGFAVYTGGAIGAASNFAFLADSRKPHP